MARARTHPHGAIALSDPRYSVLHARATRRRGFPRARGSALAPLARADQRGLAQAHRVLGAGPARRTPLRAVAGARAPAGSAAGGLRRDRARASAVRRRRRRDRRLALGGLPATGPP